MWNQGADRTALPLEALGDNLFIDPSSFWWLPAFLGLWPHYSNCCLCLDIDSFASVCIISPCLSLIRTVAIGLRVYLYNLFISRSLIVSAKTIFPNKVIFTGAGDSDMDILWGSLFNLLHQWNCFFIFRILYSKFTAYHNVGNRWMRSSYLWSVAFLIHASWPPLQWFHDLASDSP